MKVERAISYAIFNPDGRVLTVKRPTGDPDLPEIWGLPAGTVVDNESIEESVLRSGFEKLGVVIEPTKFIGRGHKERDRHLLLMEVYEAKIIQGNPSVGQEYKEVTQYTDLKWADAKSLKPAAQDGSLCSEVFLKGYRDVYNVQYGPTLDTE